MRRKKCSGASSHPSAYSILALYLQVERVTKKCDLPEDLIRHQYKDFMNLCPEGNMTKEKFLQLAEVRFI